MDQEIKRKVLDPTTTGCGEDPPVSSTTAKAHTLRTLSRYTRTNAEQDNPKEQQARVIHILYFFLK